MCDKDGISLFDRSVESIAWMVFWTIITSGCLVLKLFCWLNRNGEKACLADHLSSGSTDAIDVDELPLNYCDQTIIK